MAAADGLCETAQKALMAMALIPNTRQRDNLFCREVKQQRSHIYKCCIMFALIGRSNLALNSI